MGKIIDTLIALGIVVTVYLIFFLLPCIIVISFLCWLLKISFNVYVGIIIAIILFAIWNAIR